MKCSLFISVFAFISILIRLVRNLSCVPIEPSYLITTKILITTFFLLLKFNNGSLVPHPLFCPHPRLIIIIYQCIYPRIYLLKTRHVWKVLTYCLCQTVVKHFVLYSKGSKKALIPFKPRSNMIKYSYISCVGFLPSPLLLILRISYRDTFSLCVGALERSDASVSYVLALFCLSFFPLFCLLFLLSWGCQ